MNKKGFTLIELVAVIVVLSIIVLITTISVSTVIKKSRESLSTTQKRNIENAAKVYYLEEGMGIDDTYGCVSINELVEKGYIESAEVINPETEKELIGSVKIEYDSKKYTYTYQDKSCFCNLVKDKGEEWISPGDIYSCKVDPDKEEYTFYVIGKNEDGTTNLILNSNVCEDGSLENQYKSCSLSWYDETSGYGNSYGPVTAMNQLYNVTKNWTLIPNIIMDYNDEGNNYGGIKTEGNITKIIDSNGNITATYENLKARMLYYSEIFNYDSSYGYLSYSYSWGYYTLSSVKNSYGVWGYKRLEENLLYEYGTSAGIPAGVRPVITLRLS